MTTPESTDGLRERLLKEAKMDAAELGFSHELLKEAADALAAKDARDEERVAVLNQTATALEKAEADLAELQELYKCIKADFWDTLQAKKAELATLKAERDDYSARLEKIKAAFSEADKLADSLAGQLAAAEAERDALRERHSDAQAKLMRLEGEAVARWKRIEQLQKETR